MNNNKRNFLKSLGAYGLMAFNPLLSNYANAMKSLVENYNEALKSNFNGQQINFNSDRIIIKAPKLAENGSSVPVKTSLTNLNPDEYISKIWYIVNENQIPFALEFSFTKETGFGDVGTQLRFSKASKITAIYKNNHNELFANAKFIKVINGGCGISKDKIRK